MRVDNLGGFVLPNSIDGSRMNENEALSQDAFVHFDKEYDILSKFSKSRIDLLIKENQQIKNYMRMVIHDMRNPTVAIKAGLKDVMELLVEVNTETENQIIFQTKCKELMDKFGHSQSCIISDGLI